MSKLMSIVAVSIVSIVLHGCGGSGNNLKDDKTASINNTHPSFSRSKITVSPSYLPSGSIYELNPIFTWPVTLNATDYEIGHQNISDDNTWESFYVGASEANCSNSGSTQCTFKSIFTFAYGEERVWWIRPKIGGTWKNWTSSFAFTVNQSNLPAAAPQTLLPFGVISTTTPSFSWKSVANASEYIIGYEEENTDNSWEQITIPANTLGCQTSTLDCSFTAPANIFKNGDIINWWMRAKVANNLSEWTRSKVFTVDTSNVGVGTPTTISPIGTINTVSPSFKWTAVDNAIEYNIAYTELNTPTSWKQITVLSSSLSCQSTLQDCTHTLPTNTFENGNLVEWWVRAKVANTVGEWSNGKEFNIDTPLGLSTPLIPNGTVDTVNPIFKWTAVLHATGYKLGYEKRGVDNSWEEITLPSTICQNLSNECIYNFPSASFKDGDDIVWFIKAFNANKEGNWTSGTDLIVKITPAT